jgi:tetratricopeptide (TPR) repeat protein
VTVAIVSNVVVPLEVLLAERLLYLPSAGWAVAVAGAAGLAATVMHRRTALVAAVVAVVVAFGMRSAWRAPVWRSNETLYAQMLREAPDSYRTHWGLGALAFARGDSAAGERAWRDAIRLNPADPQPLEDLGRLYARTGRWADAVPLLERVIARDSSRIGSALALGTAYLRTNRLDAAGELLTAMGARHAAEPMFPAMLAGLRRRQGDYGGAVDAAREAVRRDSADWQLWLLAAETAGLAGDCAMLNEMAAGARRLGGLEAERTIEQVLAGVANRNGSCK